MYKSRLLLLFVFGFFSQMLFSQITIDLPPNHTVCEGESIQLWPTVSGGDGNYTYSWLPIIGLSDPFIGNPIFNEQETGGSMEYTLTVMDGLGEEETSSTIIDVFIPIVPNADILNVNCNGASNGAIELQPISGQSYFWSVGGVTNANIYGLTAGDYSVTIFDSFGCQLEQFFYITEPDPLQANVNSTNSNCSENNGSIEVVTVTGGVSPYEYSLDGGIQTTNSIFTGLGFGVYVVTVTDANGCTFSETVTITDSDGPIVDAGADVIVCAGESATLEAFIPGAGTSYLWSTGANTINITVSPSITTTYSVTATDDNGCSATDDVTVVVMPGVGFNENIINLTCNGSADGAIFLGGVPIQGANFSWSNGETAQNIENLSAGIYCVTVTDFNGCEVSRCMTVVEPAPMLVNIIGGPTEDCDSDFTLEAVVTGGVAPYTYVWEGPDGSVTTTTQLQGSGLISGIYTLIVTDSNGCQVTESIEINNSLQISLSAEPLNCATSQTTINTSGTSVGVEYTYEWTGPGGFISNSLEITVSEPGLYTLSVTNTSIAGCVGSQSVEVVEVDTELGEGIYIDISDCNGYRLSAVSPDNYFGPIEFLWTFPDGTTSTEWAISPSLTGAYLLMTTFPNLGCEFYFTYFIDLDGMACSVLEGYVRYDESEDCIADSGETGLQNIIVTATAPGAIYNAITDETGYYRFNLPSDNYTISSNLPSTIWANCQEEYLVDLSTPGTNVILDIPLQGDGLCPDLSVTVSSSILRRCFTSNYFITVCNEGTETALLPEVVLLLDDYINYTDASITPTSINGQQLNWTFDEIGVGECVTIVLWGVVSCDAELGQTHCTEAHASSYLFCGDTDGWSGANLELMANCDGQDVIFNVRNTGEGDLNEVVNYIIIEDGVAMMDAAGVIDNLPANNDTEFSFPANGSTYTFMLDQAADHPYTLSVTRSIEGCGTNDDGGISTGFVNQFGQQTSTQSSTVHCLENVGSWDPNDKSAIPVGYKNAHYIEPEDKINYHIRFQNTGTDTAFTVVVRDTLSELLDIRTFEPGNSSHDYELDIFGEKVLSFTFNNILLVDSFTNEPASNGFVDFSIKPKANVPLESLLENSAAIYFDFNEPVITNIVYHTLGRDFYDIVNWTNLTDAKISLNLFPNPAVDEIRLDLENTLIENQLVRILDITGKQVFESTFKNQQMLIDIQDWSSTWYVIQLFDTKGVLLGSGQLIKQ